MLLVNIFILVTLIFAQNLLLQNFNEAQFAQLDGWQLIDGLGQFSTENGLSILGGIGNFNQNTKIIKLIAAPPHYRLRVQLKLWAYNKWNDTELQIFIDKQQIAGLKVFSMLNDSFKTIYNINVAGVHNQPTFLLIVKTSKTNQTLDLSWGIRDLQILYYPCPSGCSYCQEGDIQQICQQWVKSYDHFTQLSSNLFTNEGWMIKGGNQLFKYQSCLGIPLFGFFLKGQQLHRQFYLNSHFRIKIRFFFFKIDNWSNTKVKLYVDDYNIWTYQFDDLDESISYNICESPSEFDDIVKVELTFDHSKQLTNFYFITDQLHYGTIVFGIRDFAIFTIPCSSGCMQCNYDMCLSSDNLIVFSIIQEYFTDLNFVGSNGWVLQKTQDLSNLIQDCGGKSIFGGFDKLGRGLDGKPIYAKKTYILPAHRMLKFVISIYIVDSMDDGSGPILPGDHGYISIDDQEIYSKNWGLPVTNGLNLQNICGGLWDEKIDFSTSIIHHSNRYATFKLWTDCDQLPNDESFGFRDILLYTGDCNFDCSSCSTVLGDACEVNWNLDYKELFQNTFADAQGWDNPQQITPSKIISDCEGLSILGGDYSMNYDSIMSTIVVLTDHTMIRVQLKIFLIAIYSWNGESIYLRIDGIIIYSQSMFSTYFNRLCDANIDSTAIQIDEIINHSSSSVRIELQSNLQIDSSSDCGFGVRDVVIQQNVF